MGCGFRDLYDQFTALGIQLVGVTFGPPSLNNDWVNSEGFQYEIWTDDNKELAIYYGAADDASAWVPDRVTRLLDANGELMLEYNAVDFNSSPAEILADCQLIFGQ